MTLREITARISDDPALSRSLGKKHADLAVAEAAQPMVIAAIAGSGDRRPVVVVTATTNAAERLTSDLETWLGTDNAQVFPAWETLPFERVSPAVETMGRRTQLLWQLRAGTAPKVLVLPVRALLQRLSPSHQAIEPLRVTQGDQLVMDDFITELVNIGYRRDSQVEHRGDVAVRGSIIDVYPSTGTAPIRIDLWGDEVDRLTEFAVADQRATDPIETIDIFPCREVVPGEAMKARAEQLMIESPWGREQWQRYADGQFFDGMESWLPWFDENTEVVGDLLGDDAHVILIEPQRLRRRAGELLAEEADLAATLATTWGASEAIDSGLAKLHTEFERALSLTTSPIWSISPSASSPAIATVEASGWDRALGEGRGPIPQLRRLIADGYQAVVAVDNHASVNRIHGLLAEEGLDLSLDPEAKFTDGRNAHVVVAPLVQGCVLPSLKLAVLSEPELTGRRRAHRKRRHRAQRSADLDDLKSGSYVVHRQHGIAKYSGMQTRAIGGVERDYLVLEYRGTDRLYLPSDQIDAIRHYTGGDSPNLSRMGGADWQKAKGKAQAAVAEVAQELVLLYQQRVTTPGHAFGPDTPWQAELEASFPFQETPDQLKAIDEVKGDMERALPMDRLICGDVGFGKTEIALRGAFKAMQDGKQVAVLVPTTLLAQQHYQTFSDRFAAYPIRVEVLSRFLTAAQVRKVIEDLAKGEVDLVVGTHRLLSKDIKIPNLGLLVIDEEQRFGVKHKESIKQIKAAVDVLTLSATPIPRTLELSLTGIRDLTLLHTPPAERQPILTYVGEYDERAVAEAIRRELLREGQVFFVHNRVQDIEQVADELRSLIPEARVAVAHGQLDEGSLEQVVYDFWEQEYDVLVCTTIIESGIDMPNVNTLVVDRADLLGLGQMHQLRGRVGRSGQRAYAYLFHPVDKVLSEEAYERLKTVGEATELGSGFRIAMRDLEIRGAGNLVGTGQSGHIAAVGYDLYCQLVTEAVSVLKGEKVEIASDVKIEIPAPASLPESYAPKEAMRLMAYRRLSNVSTLEEVADVAAEWEDRFGPIPPPAQMLLAIAKLRVLAMDAGIEEIVAVKGPGFGGPTAVARIRPVTLAASKELRLSRLYPKSKYDPDNGLLQLAVSSRAEAVPETIAALTDLEIFPADASPATEQEPARS
jgi:transcription-repair coupling factor (superfamily II helicase)